MANHTVLDILRNMRNGSEEVATPDPAITQASHDIDKIISPILYVFGFPGNILSIIVWLQPRMRHSSGTYLAALGFVDLLFLVIHVLFEIYKVWEIHMFDAPVICELLPAVFMATQYLSPLLVLAFTVERFIGVRFPAKRPTYCTTFRAKLTSFGLALFSAVLGSMQAYFYQYNARHEFCGLRESVVKGGTASVWSIWTWITEMLVFMCVPLLILIFNLLIIREVSRLAEFEASCKAKAMTTTFSLLVVSFYFIITTFPVSIVYGMRYYFIPTESTEVFDVNKQAKYFLAKAIIEEIGTTHHACKFYIFLITERLFRQEFVKVMLGIVQKPGAHKGYVQQTEVTAHTTWNEADTADTENPDETDM